MPPARGCVREEDLGGTPWTRRPDGRGRGRCTDDPKARGCFRQRRSEWNRILETYTLFGGVRERHNFNSYRLRDRDPARSS